MIDPKELRLGNFVYDDEGVIAKIVGFTPFEHSVRSDEPEGCELLVVMPHGPFPELVYEIKSTDAESIPLTPEILELCGFAAKDYVYQGGSSAPGFLNGKFLIRFIPEADGYCCEYFPYAQSHNCLPGRMSYLHQLQNNYFCWTSGTELTVNLDKVKV